MTAPKKTGLTITISGAMVALALIWGGKIEAKVEQVQGFYKILEDINTRLSRIEGALGVKKIPEE